MDKYIKMGKKIKLEMKILNISANIRYHRIYKLNFYDVDKIKTLKYFQSVVLTKDDFSQIDLIVKFCEVTFLPITFYDKDDLPDKYKNKLKRHNIKFKTYKKNKS